jgi:hypothetical protein
MENKECCCCCSPDLVLRIIEKILDHKCHDMTMCGEHGKITLTTGQHEVFIKTKTQCCKVFLASTSCHQICGAQTDLFNAIVVPEGFVLIADVKSDSIKLEWMACGEKECCTKECC